jgi:Escherichia/Staphylococcus phage prohead protease
LIYRSKIQDRREVNILKPVIEIRGDSVFISGYANITEKQSHFINENGRTFKEVIKEGAFKKSLQREKDVSLLMNHDNRKVLGSTSSGIRMFEDEVGLKVEGTITDPEIVQKVREQRSFFNAWSFGFFDRSSEWLKKDGYEQREISDLHLVEVSLLSGLNPAYPSAKNVEVRSDGMLERRITDFELKSIADLSRYEKTLTYLKLKLKGSSY